MTPLKSLPILALLAGLPATASAETTLRILHVNDVHARYDETTSQGSFCTDKDRAENKCLGGAARLQTKLRELRTPDSLFLDAGDQYQGTLYYTFYKSGAVQTILSMLKPDAQTLGNHEFDDGPGGLAPYLDYAPWPVLSANLDTRREPKLRGKYKPWTIIDRPDGRIGVVGLTTVDTPITSTPGPTVSFAPEAEALQKAVDTLRARGVKRIIALTHVGYGEDLKLAAQVDGVDVFVGGHSHTLLETGNAKAGGPYPTVVKSPSGAPSLVVQAAAYSLYLGQIDVTFDDAGVPVRWEGKPILLSPGIAKDPEVASKVEELSVPLAQLRRQPVGEATVELQAAACRATECNIGNLVADALLWGASSRGAQVAIMNGGGIRTSIPAGQVTMGQVIEVLPFSNTLATVELSGADLLKALELGVSRAHDPNASGTGRFPQVAGMRFAFDAAKPEGGRISSVEIRTSGGYAPLDPSATYKVATNNFMRTGGDGYAVFAAGRNAYDYGPNIEMVVADYIKAHGPVAPAIEGRITRRN
ncbi:bifunctional metallophosphatase/5'-nucleotidase [Arenibaculum pallidiluteum]|uniref:bifunctional metallophosphatase/5'-nucleotidase n=1 Tax=Arenibaculum pallidiluteum TaxID=2812559 RepID=UPI001A96A855|nr:bifunctional metallophosphatase/5'-nucleotidase [Arenibaculum pallidiluteum]